MKNDKKMVLIVLIEEIIQLIEFERAMIGKDALLNQNIFNLSIQKSSRNTLGVTY